MADIFAGRTIVSRGEGVERIADAIDVIEELADLAAPGFCAGERVIGDETQASRQIALKMQREGVVTGAIVGAENGYAGETGAAIVGHARLERVISD